MRVLAVLVVLCFCTLASLGSMRVCIDPGHGGYDPGALGVNGDNEPGESDFNMYMANIARLNWKEPMA